MTQLMMPSDYGSEMLLGSSPVLGSSFLGGSPHANSFFADYSRIPSIWGHNPHPSSGTTATKIKAQNIYNVTLNNTQNTSPQPSLFNYSSQDRFDELGHEENGLNHFSVLRNSFHRKNLARKSQRKNKKPPPPNNLNQPTKSCLILRTDVFTDVRI